MYFRFLFISSLVGLFLFSGCSKKQESDSKSLNLKTVPNIAEATTVLERADRVPNFSWKDAQGRTTDFDSYRGKVTLINFWATWCGPCKAEMPDLIAISKEMANEGVKILGVSTDRGTNVRDDVTSFIAEKGIPYQIVIANEELEEAFGNIRLIPTTFLIDVNGKIVQTIVGMRSKQQFVEAINTVLK